MMSGPLQLNDLPPEVLEKIFLHLTVPDILRLKLVNRTFHDVVSDQPRLQYKCELVAAGLIDNPAAPGSFFDRRTNLHKYRSRFDGLKPIGKSSLPLGATGTCYGHKSSGNVYVMRATTTNTLHFCRSRMGRSVETWSLPLPFEPENFLIHPPLDLLVITDEGSNRVYFWSMTTGHPHPLAANQWIEDRLWPVYAPLPHPGLVISVSDHMLAGQLPGGRLILWNWRTGAKVLDSTNIHPHWIAFIGSDRLLVYAYNKNPVLVLFDMSTLTDSTAALRQVRFELDPLYRNARARIVAEEAGHSDFSGVMGQDVPFYPDPSQRVLALLLRDYLSIKVICLHSETFLRLAEEIREGVVEWDMWGKFTVTPDLSGARGHSLHATYSVSGSRFVRVYADERDNWVEIKVYDLSHWSRQHPDAELDGDGESGGGKVRCQLTEEFLELPESMWNVHHVATLQDSIVFFSLNCQRSVRDPHAQGTLNIWNFW